MTPQASSTMLGASGMALDASSMELDACDETLYAFHPPPDACGEDLDP